LMDSVVGLRVSIGRIFDEAFSMMKMMEVNQSLRRPGI
jgi:hypothetical protein